MHKPLPRRKSVLRQDLPLSITHGTAGLAGFLLGLLVLVGVAASAADAPTPSLTGQVNQLKLDVAGLLNRLAKLETRVTKLDGGEAPAPKDALGPLSSCESLGAALPSRTDWASRSSNIVCQSQSIIGLPQKKFLSVTGHYLYADNTEETQDVALQIFDLDADSTARQIFLTKAAYEATDFNLVKRMSNSVNGMDGVFTYEGLPVRNMNFIHGANWFVYKNRYGILVHTSANRLADKSKLDDLVSKLDLAALDAIQ